MKPAFSSTSRSAPRLAAPWAAAVALLLAVPASASASGPTATAHLPIASHLTRPAPAPSAGVRRACAAQATPGQMACLALVRTGLHAGLAGGPSTTTAYAPAQLQSAYDLAAASAARGAGETVAVVDAYDDPNAVSDLAAYRHRWGLPACDATTGTGCVTKVNQAGQASPLPGTDPTGGWEMEESLDLDMVSAVCPNCHILLVEARSAGTGDLGAAENTAVRVGARFVTNSWGGTDAPGLIASGSDFDHPGVAITVASGDTGFGTYFPASSQFVTSVGGTTLTRASTSKRGWRETIWSVSDVPLSGASGSGCAANPVADAQPSWQQAYARTRSACPNRVDNDVAAVANPATPVWAYDTYPSTGGSKGWNAVGGTSVASPIIASVYALAGIPAAGSYPASYLYQSGHAADLNDVTAGSTGTCRPAVLCTGERGYDGPTGWGTPQGTGAFTSTQRANTVTVADPGTRDYQAGSAITLPVQATDTASGPALRYSASGLPVGVSIDAATGVISGTLPRTGGTATVTLTVTDHTGATGTVTFHLVTVPGLRAAYHPVPGPITVHTGFKGPDACLQTPPAGGAKVVIWSCDGQQQQSWTYRPDTQPGNDGTLTLRGRCLDLATNSKLQLGPCTGAPSQQWSLQEGAAWIYNPASRRCLNDPGDSTVNGTQVDVAPCEFASFPEFFTLPAGPVLSGVAGLCMTDPGDSKVSGTAVEVRRCDGGPGQLFSTFSRDRPPYYPANLFLGSVGTEPGGPIEVVNGRTPYVYGGWFPMPDGEIWNLATGLCLDDPHTGRTGTKLVASFCSGQQGEIWAVS